MNFEINDYDSGHESFLNKNRYKQNNRDYEQEYEFQNNYKRYNSNIDDFISPKRLSNVYNSSNNISNNISPHGEKKIDIYNSKSNEAEENIIPSPLNNFNNYMLNYMKESKSINLLNFTDKIYESDEHFKKGLLYKKRENSDKNLKNKKSSRSGNKKSNRKSLFINNGINKINKLDGKQNINVRKRRESYVIKNKDKNNLGNLYKIKLRKNSAVAINHEIEKNNNDTNNEENKINKNKKLLSFKTIKEEPSSKGSQIHIIKYTNKKTIKNNKKNKLSLGEQDIEEKVEKMTTKKSNNKIDKISGDKIFKINEINEKTQNKDKDIKDEKNEKENNKNDNNDDNKKENNKKDNKAKNKQKFCLFCCLNSKLDDSEIK